MELKPDMPEIRELILQLSSADRATRKRAALEFYRIGSELGDSAMARWRADQEIASLIERQLTVGVAVKPENFEAIHAAAGWPELADVPPDQDAREFELLLDTARLDILTTRDPGGKGAIARFLNKLGEGIQQVEYPTRDVDQATELLRARLQIESIYAATRPGADGTRINFFLASTPQGRKVLIELVEKAE